MEREEEASNLKKLFSEVNLLMLFWKVEMPRLAFLREQYHQFVEQPSSISHLHLFLSKFQEVDLPTINFPSLKVFSLVLEELKSLMMKILCLSELEVELVHLFHRNWVARVVEEEVVVVALKNQKQAHPKVAKEVELVEQVYHHHLEVVEELLELLVEVVVVVLVYHHHLEVEEGLLELLVEEVVEQEVVLLPKTLLFRLKFPNLPLMLILVLEEVVVEVVERLRNPLVAKEVVQVDLHFHLVLVVELLLFVVLHEMELLEVVLQLVLVEVVR